MEELYVLIRNLAVILLLASFIEMMLPSKSMQGFVRLVMGLFVISAILTPITALMRMPLEMNIPAWTETSTSDMPVLASGEEGVQISQSAVQEQYKMIIENQIKAVVINVPGVKNAEVKIEMEEQMQRLPRIIGPGLIVFIALIIGGVAVGILLPIFDVGTHL